MFLKNEFLLIAQYSGSKGIMGDLFGSVSQHRKNGLGSIK